jgi:hypothetical protein
MLSHLYMAVALIIIFTTACVLLCMLQFSKAVALAVAGAEIGIL